MTSEIKIKHQQAYLKMKEADKILLVGHLNPDGDDLSSLGILNLILASLGKQVFSYCEGRRGPEFSFLPGTEKIISFKEELVQVTAGNGRQDWIDDFDLIITSDCGSLERTNLAIEIKNRQKAFLIEFDHHQKIISSANLEIRLPEKSSTAELLYDFLSVNNIKIDKRLATNILTGIITDTGNFLYPSASASTLSVAAKMLSRGANINRIISAVLQNKKMTTLKLLSRALENLRISSASSVAISALRHNDFEELGRDFATEAFDDIVAVLASLSGVKAVLLLREYEPGRIRGSWRSKPGGYDVSLLARSLGGGGHKHAAGFQIDGRIVDDGNFWKIAKE